MQNTSCKRKLSESLDSNPSNSTNFLPAYRKKSSINPSRLIRHIFKRFNEEKFLELEADIKNYGVTVKELTELFLTSWIGKALLCKTITMSTNYHALAFLVKNMPSFVLELLNQTQYESFNQLISLKQEYERLGLHDSLEKINQDNYCQIQKYKLLLELDANAIQAYFRQYKSNGLITFINTILEPKFNIGCVSHIIVFQL